ncbi:FAD-dependent monooxygenase [Bacillus sp. CGMCC 1.16607]|uniref:FAD-dependent monooxygenase n=1 Tax=Bacillus sp. CGMCC 1.16607 TaxID=3351842 RepID=UPI00363DC937
MNKQVDVCIVGGGPGGALLAFLLAKQNISTILLERHEGIDKEFRGEHLNEVGEQIFKKYNLYEKIKDLGLLLMKRIEYWEQGEIIKIVTPEAGNEHVGIHVPQNHLLSVIYNESAKLESYQSMLGTKVIELIQDEKGKYIGVKALKNDEVITIYSSVIIGADGRFSTVRKLANISTTIIQHGYDLLWAKIRSPENWEPTIRFALVEGNQLALFTQTGGYIQIGWNIEEDSYSSLKKEPYEPFIKQLISAFPELSDTIRQHILSCKDFVLLKVQSCRCETWVKDGLIIMGDAAHTMSPTGAIGVNSALKDADVLVEILKNAIQNNDFSMKQLKTFEYIRREPIEKLQQEQLKREASFYENFK